jgi:hypothetical protein
MYPYSKDIYSYRGAAVCKAVSQGVLVDLILKTADLSTESVFTRFYRGDSIDSIDEVRDLGITITYNLKWDSHVIRIRSTANKCLGLLERTCYDLYDTRARRALYLSLVKSQLSYGSQEWSPESATLKKIIEGVQRRASLWILRLKRGDLAYVDRLKKLDLLPLSYDREIKDLTFYYKCRYGLIDLDRQCIYRPLFAKLILLKHRTSIELSIYGT